MKEYIKPKIEDEEILIEDICVSSDTKGTIDDENDGFMMWGD